MLAAAVLGKALLQKEKGNDLTHCCAMFVTVRWHHVVTVS